MLFLLPSEPSSNRKIRSAPSLGANPESIPRGRAITDQPLPNSIPAGLPSRLLERRPDIEQAEQQLASANAQIGVAHAQLFLQVSLTGTAGLESIGFGNLFTWPARAWNWTGAASPPIFNAGALRANVYAFPKPNSSRRCSLTNKQSSRRSGR